MKRPLLVCFLVLGLVTTACSSAGSESGEAPATPEPASGAPTTAATTAAGEPSVRGEIPAPEFRDGLDWLNTATPIRMADLEGKVVLLDFWTYGCINCIHIIPDLERLEEEYRDELVVIGVHSAKFTNEGATENIRQVVLRYGIEHPVVNDPDFLVWRDYQVNAWPTVFLIDPVGNILGAHSGENVYEVVQPLIATMVSEFGDRGQIDRTSLELDLESEGLPRTLLSFPGKVLAAPDLDRLFIADSGNHRVVELVPGTGEVTAVYGSGRRGFVDGEALTARFDSPQGMALSPERDVLYVADTNNHALRTIDLNTGVVSTAVGTGRQASTYPPAAGTAPTVELSSPWDVAVDRGLVYVAMAGSHQIWTFDPATRAAAPLVGTGGESTKNGPASESELAQPSGLVIGDDGRLYFADSESSSIRITNLMSADLITATLAGSDQSLFDFGDVDGTGTAARFQHPLGIDWDTATGTIVFADTYNSKIKRVDPATGLVTTLYGGEQGWADGAEPLFFEPGGISYTEDVLYVADTNNHVVRAIANSTGVASTIVVQGIDRFTPPPDDEAFAGTIIEIDAVAAGHGPGSFVLDITLPADHKVNEQATSSVEWRVQGEAVAMAAGADRSLTGATFPVEVGADFATGESVVTADVTIVYCREHAESLCFIEQLRFRVPVTVGDTEASSRITLPYGIELPDL